MVESSGIAKEVQGVAIAPGDKLWGWGEGQAELDTSGRNCENFGMYK